MLKKPKKIIPKFAIGDQVLILVKHPPNVSDIIPSGTHGVVKSVDHNNKVEGQLYLVEYLAAVRWQFYEKELAHWEDPRLVDPEFSLNEIDTAEKLIRKLS